MREKCTVENADTGERREPFFIRSRGKIDESQEKRDLDFFFLLFLASTFRLSNNFQLIKLKAAFVCSSSE